MHPLGANRAYDHLAHIVLGGAPSLHRDGARSFSPAPTRSLTRARFRDALGRFPTGVAFVTAMPDGEPAGLIVGSLTSVSLEPLLLSFCPSRGSLTWSQMRRTQRLGVNVLGRRHEGFARSSIDVAIGERRSTVHTSPCAAGALKAIGPCSEE